MDSNADPIRSASTKAGRTRVHVGLAVGAWIAFGWAWTTVFVRRLDTVSGAGLVFLLAYLVVMLVTTLAWRAHNRRLHARLGPRSRVPRVRETWRTDHLGRILRADWRLVRAARVVHVDVGDDAKIFRVEEKTS